MEFENRDRIARFSKAKDTKLNMIQIKKCNMIVSQISPIPIRDKCYSNVFHRSITQTLEVKLNDYHRVPPSLSLKTKFKAQVRCKGRCFLVTRGIMSFDGNTS